MTKARILIVEDEVVVAIDIETRLRAIGYEVVGRVSTGAEAVRWAEERAPDLVLMDIRLKGGMDGIDAAHQIRVRFGLPVVFLTAHADEQTVDRAKLSEPFGYLLKPFHDRELRTAVEVALYRQRIEADLREHERELRHRETELTAIYDSAPFMMCLVDRGGRMVRHNRALGQLAAAAGHSPTEPVPEDFLLCLLDLEGGGDGGRGAGGECSPLRAAVREALASGTASQQVESRLRVKAGKTGQEVWVSASATRIEIGAEPLVLVCMEDITQRRRLEAQFLQAQKMEAVGQLAGGIAHDFNNILAAMLMNLGLMRNPSRYEGDPYDALSELERLAQRAADLTRQLLLFGRRQVMQPVRIDLNVVVGGLFRMLRRLLGDHIEVRLACGTEPMWIEADPGMIEQVIVNLVVNARDAMPSGGRLVIGADRLEVQAGDGLGGVTRKAGWYVRLRVVDTGTGMDEQVMARIFEPFFTTKEKGHGTGLGLSTVQGIVDQHRGWLEVESEVGKGTAFWVHLPAASGPPAAEVGGRGSAATSAGGTETVLLVEDAPAVRRMVAMTLRSLGYQVVEASDGDEAVDRWNRDPAAIDLVLTDMVMPGGLSGLELIERLRQTRPELRAVISSGYSLDLVRQGNPSLKGVVYLPKPYQSDGLAKAVRECLDGGGGGLR